MNFIKNCILSILFFSLPHKYRILYIFCIYFSFSSWVLSTMLPISVVNVRSISEAESSSRFTLNKILFSRKFIVYVHAVLHPSLQDLCNAGSCYCYLVRFPEECCLIPRHCKHSRTSYSSRLR